METSKLKDIYGPGNDNYGRNKPSWKVETDVCGMCGKDTKIPKTTSIFERAYYVEGAGQLCRECFDKIYK